VASRYAISGPVFAQVEPWQACCLHSSRTIAVNTGISGRKKSTQIAGLPQLFTAKGHETLHHWVHDRLRQLGHVPPNSWLRYRRDDVGLVLEDAAEHYDGLNTLADITGVPEGGFLLRSVRRTLRLQQRTGLENVRSPRPRASAESDSILLQNTVTDHTMTTDLFPELSEDGQRKRQTWRDRGRSLDAYYTRRLAAECRTL